MASPEDDGADEGAPSHRPRPLRPRGRPPHRRRQALHRTLAPSRRLPRPRPGRRSTRLGVPVPHRRVTSRSRRPRAGVSSPCNTAARADAHAAATVHPRGPCTSPARPGAGAARPARLAARDHRRRRSRRPQRPSSSTSAAKRSGTLDRARAGRDRPLHRRRPCRAPRPGRTTATTTARPRGASDRVGARRARPPQGCTLTRDAGAGAARARPACSSHAPTEPLAPAARTRSGAPSAARCTIRQHALPGFASWPRFRSAVSAAATLDREHVDRARLLLAQEDDAQLADP